ncbi:MAG: thrombospondin type-1 domain-containing protein [Candidatus Paceibacterota bacterium]|jgi:hypothetical protein
MSKKIFLVLLTVVSMVIIPIGTKAQQPESLTSVDCFDFYKFGSVQINISPKITKSLSGTDMDFSIGVANENTYPIVDGSVYIKIFQKQKDLKLAQKNGDFLIDQFFVKEGMTLDTRQATSFDFSWKIPAWAPEGDYLAVAYFQSAKKFNLMGLTFTDDIKGNQVGFSIASDFKNSVAWDKNGVKINDKDYLFAAPIPRLGKDEKIKISAPLKNPTKQNQKAEISFDVYFWDGLLSSQRVETKQETVDLAPGETKTVTYELTDNKYPAYFLVAKSKWNDFSSIINVRFAREGIDRPRINFPALTKFPLKKGETATIFSCIHDVGTAGVVSGRLEIKLLDEKGAIIKNSTYSGDITDGMMGFKTDFTAQNDLDVATIKASLFDAQNLLVDEVEMKYNCQEIDPAKCSNKGTEPVSSSSDSSSTKPIFGDSSYWIYGLIGIGAAIIIVIFILIRKRKRNDYVNMGEPQNDSSGGMTNTTATGMKILFFLIFSVSLILSGSSKADAAQSYTYTFKPAGSVEFGGSLNPIMHGLVSFKLDQPFYQFTYTAKVIDKAGNDIQSSTVNTGSWVVFSANPSDFLPSGSQTAYWFGSGGFYDSPYGYWLPGAPQKGTCEAQDYIISRGAGGKIFKFFTPLSANPPPVTIAITNNPNTALTKCSDSANGYIKTCFVSKNSGGGSVKATVSFGATTAKQYLEYFVDSVCRKYPQTIGGALAPGVSATPFLINVPARSFNLSFKAIGGSATTTDYILPPEIQGPTVGKPGQAYTFTTLSSSTITSDITYNFYWDQKTTVNDFRKVSSTQEASTNRTWATTSSSPFTLYVQAVSQVSATTTLVSGWGVHEIRILDNATCFPADYWTACSRSCGGGKKNLIHIGADCSSSVSSTVACNTQKCGTTIIEVPPG